MTTKIVTNIHRKLQKALSPRKIEIIDDNKKYQDHSEARKKNIRNFTVIVVADIFTGKKALQRHRIIYDILQDFMTSEIDALGIRTFTMEEYRS